MSKDFKAAQLRVSQIIGDNNVVGQPNIAIINSTSPGVDYAGSGIANPTLMAGVGENVFLFVTGSKGSIGSSVKGTVLFGGDVYVSGVLHTSSGAVISGVGGANTQIQFNENGSLSGDSGLVYQRETQTLLVGNLTVTGSVTYVTSSNLVISDPVLYIASGGLSSNQNGGIAISSGSSSTDESLVLGRVANDTWGVGKKDVQGGMVTDLTDMKLVPFRTSKLELGDQNTYITSSVGSYISVNASTVVISSQSFGSSLPPATDVYLYVSGAIGSSNSSIRGTTVFGGDVHTSGSFSQGYQNKTTGDYSFAAGALSEAVSFGTFVHGTYLIGSGNYQHIVGKYNDESFSTENSFVIGNGTFESRSDLLRAYGSIVEITGTLSATAVSGTTSQIGSNQTFANLSSKPAISNEVDTSLYSVTGSLYMSSSAGTEQKVLGSHAAGIFSYGNTSPQILAPGVFEIIDWSSSGGLVMTGSGNVIADVSQNGIILNKVGLFSVFIQTSVSGSADSSYGVSARLGSTTQPQVSFENKLDSLGSISSTSCSGLVYNPTIGNLLSAWIISDSSGVVIKNGQLTVLSA